MSLDELRHKQWVIVRVGDSVYGIDGSRVKEMVQMPTVTRMPKLPDYVRGVINLRGAVIPTIDMRMLLGSSSAVKENEEMIALLNMREEDHRKWITELERCVLEKDTFKGQLDPHKCAFGKWYDGFTTSNAYLANALKKFDAPHKRIHAIGAKVAELVAQGRTEDAMEIIEFTKNLDLKELVNLFAEAREIVLSSFREIGLILENDGVMMAVTVDTAESVETLDPESFEELALREASTVESFMLATARRNGNKSIVMLLNSDYFLKIAGTARRNIA